MGIVIKKAKGKAGSSVVPDGTYGATLSEVRQFENSYGDRLGFEFTLHGDEVEGSTVMRSTSIQLTMQSKLAEMLRALIGRALTDQELNAGIDLEQFIGNTYQVAVRQKQGKHGHTYSNVEHIFN